MSPKKELFRIVRQPDGVVAIDAIGKVSGRGAYLCKKHECVSMAKKRGTIERNLGVDDCGALYTSLLEICGENDQ
jgi:predicted RNA-binding protein YlxR (DUF448 family)